MPRQTTRSRFKKAYGAGLLSLGRSTGNFSVPLINPNSASIKHAKGVWVKATIVSNETSTNPNNYIAGNWGFLRLPRVMTGNEVNTIDTDDARYLASKPFVSTPARPAYEEIHLKAVNITGEDRLHLKVTVAITSADTHNLVYAYKFVEDEELW